MIQRKCLKMRLTLAYLRCLLAALSTKQRRLCKPVDDLRKNHTEWVPLWPTFSRISRFGGFESSARRRVCIYSACALLCCVCVRVCVYSIILVYIFIYTVNSFAVGLFHHSLCLSRPLFSLMWVLTRPSIQPALFSVYIYNASSNNIMFVLWKELTRSTGDEDIPR
jgi:hypothetical protein